MFPIGYHIYPKLFVCVNTFSRDKVVVPVLLRLSLSLTPPISPFYLRSGLASTSLVRTRTCTPSTRVTFGQRFDFCLSREIWAILALRIPLWYQQLRLEYYLFRQLCPLTLSTINPPHTHTGFVGSATSELHRQSPFPVGSIWPPSVHRPVVHRQPTAVRQKLKTPQLIHNYTETEN